MLLDLLLEHPDTHREADSRGLDIAVPEHLLEAVKGITVARLTLPMTFRSPL